MKLSEIGGDTPETEAPKPIKLSQVGATAPAEGGSKIESLWNQLAGGIKAGGAGLKQGLSEVALGTAQLAEKMAPPAMLPHARETQQALQADLKQDIQKGEQSYQADPNVKAHALWAGLGRIGGNVAGTAPLMAIPGGQATMAGRLGAGAAAGALGGATAPVAAGDYWSEKAKQMGLGAAGGAAVGAAGSMLARPASRPAQQLMQRGVPLTPGQAMGGMAQATERYMSAFPFVRSLIRGGERRSLDGFNRAVVNQALEPIGAVAPTTMRAGHDLMDHATSAFNAAYDRALTDVTFRESGKMTREIDQLREMVNEAPADVIRQFDTILKNRVDKRFGAAGTPVKTGSPGMQSDELGQAFSLPSHVPAEYHAVPPRSMDGQTLKLVEKDLRKAADRTRDDELRSALYQLRSIITDNLAEQNPRAAEQLSRANAGYAMFARVRQAAGRRLDSEGVLTPQDLLAAVRSQDRSAGKGDFARGDALMQSMGELGMHTLSRTGGRDPTPRIMQDLATAIPGLAMTAPYAIAQRSVPGTMGHAIGQAVEKAAPVTGEEAAKIAGRKRDYFERRGYRIPEDDARPADSQ